MKLILKKSLTILMVCSILSTMFLATSVNVIAAETTYQTKINKGTDTYVVSTYDKESWKKTIGSDSNPSDWFGKNADKVDAKSKSTIKTWFNRKFGTFDALTDILLSEEVLMLLLFNQSFFGFTEEEINKNYPNEYELWRAFYSKWDFTTEEFDVQEDSNSEFILIFKNPKDLKDILSDYNAWISDINTLLILYGATLEPLNGDDFLWNFVISEKLSIGAPFDNYLTDLVDGLDCKHATAEGSILIFEKKGKTDYEVDIVFSERGTISSFIVKNEERDIIYELTSTNSNNTMIPVFIILLCSVAALTIVAIFWKKHLNIIRSVKKVPEKTS